MENTETADTQAGADGTESNGLDTSSTDAHAPQHSAITLEAQLADAQAKYVYLYAEFENYKRRAVKEAAELRKFGWESVARELLGVADNLDRALQFCPNDLDPNFKTGLQMVLTDFRATLQKQGVETIKAEGATFNPELHEAVSAEKSDQPQGQILSVQSQGYTLHGRLLRPARVVVSQG
jgi:molecular chaperone GrpE